MIEIITGIIIGTILGIVCGLVPGLHINLIMTLIILNLDRLRDIFPLSDVLLVSLISSISITYIAVSFIPSIFLGAPSEDNFLSVLPGHQMLREGKGYEALLLCLLGTLIAIPALVLIIPPFILFLPDVYNSIKDFIAFILIFFSLYLIFREKNVIAGLVIFILAGFLGIFTFNTPVQEPLLPLLSGLFGLSSLLISLESSKLKEQEIIPLKKLEIDKKQLLKSFFSTSFVSPFCSFLPGVGSGHAAMISSEISEPKSKYFLVNLGIINVIVMTLSFVAAYSIEKSRTGSAAAVQNILQSFSRENLVIILIVILISIILSFVITMQLGKLTSKVLNKIDYKIINISTIGIIILANVLISNWLGLIALTSATFLGLYCSYANVRKINLMGALILPSIIYFLIN